MGTRGSIGVIYQEEYKATYNHSDSYPSGLGEEAVEFVNKVIKENGWERFKKKIQKVVMITEDKKPTPRQVEKYKKFANTSVSSGNLEEWYVLLREVQGVGFLQEIYKGSLNHLLDDGEFIKHSLFCEWAYIINLDTMKLEVYKGFQKSPDPKNIFGQEENSGYYPCKKIVSVSLEKEVPSSFMQKTEKKAYK